MQSRVSHPTGMNVLRPWATPFPHLYYEEVGVDHPEGLLHLRGEKHMVIGQLLSAYLNKHLISTYYMQGEVN